jgi:autotransporter-associated beta strand protein
LLPFGTPGQDGTILWATPVGSHVNGGGVFAVAVQAGTLRAADGSFGLLFAYAGRTTVQTGATVDSAGFGLGLNDLEGGGRVTNSGGATTLQVNGGSFGGVIDGPLALNVSGGALTLSGNNAYTGGTTITGGATLTLGAGGATGSVPGAITDNGVLAINRSDSFVVNNVSGIGQLQQVGPGVTTLGAGLSYSGGTQITAGTLAVGSAAALGTGGLTISGGELLATATESISNQLSMGGNFTIAAAHNQTLTFSPASPWFLSASNNVVTFGAPGQDGAIVWATPAGSSFSFPAGASYTVLVQAGTLRAADSSFGLLLQSDQRTAIRPAATIDVAGLIPTSTICRAAATSPTAAPPRLCR